mmetsp:Transcript_17825/g.52036  ORF Transcript_17825/g.52036 Transcript_17825/m.52036 type:complete len:229 (-) Transcript_17825:72-758(-)
MPLGNAEVQAVRQPRHEVHGLVQDLRDVLLVDHLLVPHVLHHLPDKLHGDHAVLGETGPIIRDLHRVLVRTEGERCRLVRLDRRVEPFCLDRFLTFLKLQPRLLVLGGHLTGGLVVLERKLVLAKSKVSGRSAVVRLHIVGIQLQRHVCIQDRGTVGLALQVRHGTVAVVHSSLMQRNRLGVELNGLAVMHARQMGIAFGFEVLSALLWRLVLRRRLRLRFKRWGRSH